MAKARAIFISGFAVGAMACVIACIPHPDKDFDDYKERTVAFAGTDSNDAGTFDGSVVTEPTKGLYYGACLSQLAFGAPNKVFNFYTKTNFVPDGANGKLSITLQALKLKDFPCTIPSGPPTTFSTAGLLPPEQTSKEVTVFGTKVTIDFNEGTNGNGQKRPGLVLVPNDANPITCRPVEIENVKLTGTFAKEKFCALLSGTVVVPVSLELEPEKNVCQFIPVKDGDPTPILTKTEEFAASTCPR